MRCNFASSLIHSLDADIAREVHTYTYCFRVGRAMMSLYTNTHMWWENWGDKELNITRMIVAKGQGSHTVHCSDLTLKFESIKRDYETAKIWKPSPS